MSVVGVTCRRCSHSDTSHLKIGGEWCNATGCLCTRSPDAVRSDPIGLAPPPQDARPLSLERKLWRAAILSPFGSGLATVAASLVAIWTHTPEVANTAWTFGITTIPLGALSAFAAFRNEWPQ